MINGELCIVIYDNITEYETEVIEYIFSVMLNEEKEEEESLI